MENKEELKKELEALSPFLLTRKEKMEGFRVPKDYFKSLPDEVLHKTRPTPPARSSWLDELTAFMQQLWQPRYALGLAAAVVLVVAAICFFDQPENNRLHQLPVAEAILEEIPDEALQAYISQNIVEFDRELILETQYAGQETRPLPSLSPKASDDELEQYLQDNIDEIDLDELEDLL